MTEPTRWQVELGDGGEVPPLPGDGDGVLRIGCGDHVAFTLPLGSLPTLAGTPLLVARDELGGEHPVEATADATTKDLIAEWYPAQPGPYEVFVRYSPPGEVPSEEGAGTSGVLSEGPPCKIVVDPVIKIDGVPMPARAIVQLTVLSRLAGPIEEWPEVLAPQAALGYNMVHFTPIQPPGESGSCYALDDQNSVDPTLLKAPAECQEERLKAVKSSVERLEKEHGLLSAMDIVLNHTAGSAPWLLDHPECAYNVSNSPHLTAAAELDERLAWYSEELSKGSLGGPHINTPEDVDRVVDGVLRHVLQPLRLHEYFSVDVEACVGAFAGCADGARAFRGEDYEGFKEGALPSVGARRLGVVVPGEVARRCCRDEGALRAWCARLQAELSREAGGVERDVLEAVRGLVRYERLELRRGPVGPGHLGLLPRYFRRLRLSAEARARLGREEETVAHNGWVMDWPATEDFAAPSWRFVFLRRHLNAWGDCVKLRYGASPSDAPFLWAYMSQYAASMAGIFHAIRLDNAHSTPLHVSKHVLAQVRKTNPNCWVFAELFTGNFQTDLHYQRTLGINALVREAMQCYDLSDISRKLTSSLWGAHPLGALSPIPTLDRVQPSRPVSAGSMVRGSNASCALIPSLAVPLRPRSCPALLFDCTHDNQTPKEKRHPRDALPNAALVVASCASIGSVRGYDELLAANPSVVFERRLYQRIDGVEPLQLGWPQVDHQAAEPVPGPEEPEPEVQLTWPHGASTSVVAFGSWDGWKSPVPFAKQGNGQWAAHLRVPAAEFPAVYKFVVDGKWTCDESQMTAADATGNVNNALERPGAASSGDCSAHISGPDVVDNRLPGILVVKQVLNALHVQLARENFLEIGAHKLADDVVAVERRSPDSGRRTYFVVRSAFSQHGLSEQLPPDVGTLEILGKISRLHVAATLFVRDDQEVKSDSSTLLGLECYLRLHPSISDLGEFWQEGSSTRLKLTHFPPGSVLVFSTDPNPEISLRAGLDRLLTEDRVSRCLEGLGLSELNYLLFSCEAEELDRSGGARGAYDVPGSGPLVYCGLLGVCGALDLLRRSAAEPQACPLLENLRAGDWLLRYLVGRLAEVPALGSVGELLEQAAALLAQLPRQLAPFHFDLVVSSLCSAACDALLRSSGPFIGAHRGSGRLVRDLALATAQFWGATPSAPLHWERARERGWRASPSLCAGLPHFAAGFMRNWGRDTFIALRGCLLVTQRFAEARETLLVFAGVVRHGLVPNLLDSANNPRYNARDATWFFLQAIQDYVEMAPEGLDFLAAPVSLKWPVESWDGDLMHLEPANVADLIHLILSAHAKGIAFREWNAGERIDGDMTDKGFNIQVTLDEDTGIIYGGNAFNCGTWMDKMGSSVTAGNKGVPATPRDGAAVEIIGLLKSALRWVSSLGRTSFPYTSVKTSSGADLAYHEWGTRLQKSFENIFWIGPDEKTPTHVPGIYKDTHGATHGWQDFQLRPNFCIAMAVAPELFTPANAKAALKVVAERLIGPLGMCTLDTCDPEYRGDYINNDDSADKAVAHGWNYHQGPEWLWPLGFFLRAWHYFAMDGDLSLAAKHGMRFLLRHRTMLSENPWLSLPELTNSNGKVCMHSCPAQAWSLATLLDAVHTLGSAQARHCS